MKVIEDEYPHQQKKATGTESSQQSNRERLFEVTYSWAWGPMCRRGYAHIPLAIRIYDFSSSLLEPEIISGIAMLEDFSSGHPL